MKNRVRMMLAVAGLITVGVLGAGVAQSSGPQTVTVKLTEWSMGMSAMKVKGPVRFEVMNAGKFPHALKVEGKLGDQPFEISTDVLKAGEKTVLMLTLPPGTYTVDCPVGNHEERGMKDTLTVE